MMRKIGYIVTVLLFVSFTAQAQLDSNRTRETKIADLKAMQPSDNQKDLNKVMKEMEGFDKGDFSLLLQDLKKQGENNEKVEYASNSYAFHVMQSEKDQDRLTFVNGLLDALETTDDKNSKGFIFRLLVQTAEDESIDVIVPYLLDEDLAEKAGRALNQIGSDRAIKALSDNLEKADDASSTIAIVSALGDLKAVDQEKQVQAQLDKYDHPELNKTIYFALSKMGSPASQKTFNKGLKKIDYKYEENNITGAAINYAEQLKENGEKKKAVKFVRKLYKRASKSERNQAQIASLKLLNEWEPEKTEKKLVKALDSDNAELRHFALLSLGPDHKKVKGILKSLDDNSLEKQVSALTLYAEKGNHEDLDRVKPFIHSDNLQVRLAAFKAIYKLDKGNDDSVQLFINHLGSKENEQNKLLKQLILSTEEGDPIDVVNENLSEVNNKEKEDLLDILAKRKNDSSFGAAFPLTESKVSSVEDKAYKALVNVTSDTDVEQLIEQIPNLSGDNLKLTQEAIIKALQYSDKKEGKMKTIASDLDNASKPSIKVKYFPILADLGNKENLETLSEYIESSNSNVKSEAIEALGKSENKEALFVLLNLFKEDQEDDDFEVLYKGLISNIKESDETSERKALYLRDAFDQARTVNQKKMALETMAEIDSYQSLLFAGKFLDDNDDDLKSTATNTVMEIALDNPQYYGSDIRKILGKVSDNLSNDDNESSYLKEAVDRHLKEMPDGEGYVPLFNEKDLKSWEGLVENPIKRKEMSEEQLRAKQKEADSIMKAGWEVKDEELVFKGEGENITTIEDYGDFEMLVDWKLDENGKEPDAGIYLRGTPQVQIWDTSRTDVGAQVGSGGLYNNKKHEADPLTVADNPLGDWNRFKIRMIDDKVTVWLNGEMVTDSTVLENYWDRDEPIFPKEQIELQAHGSKVYYRDIYIKELFNKKEYELSQEEKDDGFEMLFDGTNLDKWTGSKSYSINDAGELWVDPEADNEDTGRDFWTEEEYDDFVFRFEFKLTAGANNGVGIRTPLGGHAAYEGMEIQILDDDADMYKDLDEFQYHGSVYGVIPAKRGSLKPVGEWNKEEIRIKGDKIKVTVNGEEIINGDIKEASKNGTSDGKDHPGLKRDKGHIGFLGHGDKVYFRNIRVKKL